jgi:hypothetical protein
MKCKICKQKTDWDSSVGRPAFLVCNHCVENLSKHMLKLLNFSNKDDIGALCATTSILLDIGYAMEAKED